MAITASVLTGSDANELARRVRKHADKLKQRARSQGAKSFEGMTFINGKVRSLND